MFSIYCRLQDRTGEGVFASDRAILRQAYLAIGEKQRHDPALKAKRKEFYRRMLEYHHHEKDMYYDVVNGNVG